MKETQRKEITEKLIADFPQLAITSVKQIGKGWDYLAVEVNESIIFRLPLDATDEEQLNIVQYETKVLQAVKNNIIVDTPDPLYIAPDGSYFGYPKLPGDLAAYLVPGFSSGDTLRFLDEWVRIALAIHNTVPLSVAEKLGVPTYDPAEIIETVQKLRGLKVQDPAVQAFADKTVQSALLFSKSEQTLSFIHNDMHVNNILANTRTHQISGIIDWSDCCIAPISKEFSTWELWHDNSLEQVAKLYEAQSSISIDVTQAKTWMHLEEIADYVEQTLDADYVGAEISLNHIQKWIVEER